MRLSFWLVVGMVAVSAVGLVGAQERPAQKGHSAAEMNKVFQDPNLDVKTYLARFESEQRDIYASRREIIEAVGLKPGMAVADVGAGTGLFALPFAERVGPKGAVYAVEIAPAFLKYIDEQAHRKKVAGIVRTVRGTQESTNLPPDSIDLAFVCATYHHFEHPEKILASLHRALRTDGRLIVIDFDLRQDSPRFVREHARGPKDVYVREIVAAGFRPVAAETLAGLKDNFLAVFAKASQEPGD
jgi:ubiquinone/menaquinone biosynthesis C-methylase UbiE